MATHASIIITVRAKALSGSYTCVFHSTSSPPARHPPASHMHARLLPPPHVPPPMHVSSHMLPPAHLALSCLEIPALAALALPPILPVSTISFRNSASREGGANARKDSLRPRRAADSARSTTRSMSDCSSAILSGTMPRKWVAREKACSGGALLRESNAWRISCWDSMYSAVERWGEVDKRWGEEEKRWGGTGW